MREARPSHGLLALGDLLGFERDGFVGGPLLARARFLQALLLLVVWVYLLSWGFVVGWVYQLNFVGQMSAGRRAMLC